MDNTLTFNNEEHDENLVYVTTEQYAEAKAQRDALQKQLADSEICKKSKNKYEIWNFNVCDKQNMTIWAPWAMLKSDGDYVDYGPWRFVFRAISEKDKKAYLGVHTSYNRHGRSQEFNENGGLCLLLTRNDNDPLWIDNTTSGTTGMIELPLSHHNTWRYSETYRPITTQQHDFFALLKRANFAPAINYEKDVVAAFKANQWGTPTDVMYHQFFYGITRVYNYTDQDKNLVNNYFSDFHSEVEKGIAAYKKNRNSVLAKINKLANVIQAYESGTALNKLTEAKKAAREEKVLENKGRKLGKEFEQFAKLAVELSRIKETISELENEIAADDCQLEHAYFNNRMDKVMVGFNALRGFIKQKKKEAAE